MNTQTAEELNALKENNVITVESTDGSFRHVFDFTSLDGKLWYRDLETNEIKQVLGTETISLIPLLEIASTNPF